MASTADTKQPGYGRVVEEGDGDARKARSARVLPLTSMNRFKGKSAFCNNWLNSEQDLMMKHQDLSLT